MLDDTTLGRLLPDPAEIDSCSGPTGAHLVSAAASACAVDGLIAESRCLACNQRVFYHHGPTWHWWSAVPLTEKLWFE